MRVHENQHTKNRSIEQETKKNREQIIREIAGPMQQFAFQNPHFTHEENQKGVLSGNFSKIIPIKNVQAIHVIMTISPADEISDKPFWHVSMSLIAPNGKPKTMLFWSKRELRLIKELLPKFLSLCGLPFTDGFLRTKTALHIHRDLTADELEQTGFVKREKNQIEH